MLDDMYFDPDLELNETKKYRHEECSKGKNEALAVTRKENGWVYHCHRCKTEGFRPISGLSPKQTAQFITAPKKPKSSSLTVELPDDYTVDITYEGLQWLYKYITDEEIGLYQIGYSRTMNRVILPVYCGNSLQYWQGRYLDVPDKDHPKYINIRKKGSKNVYFKVLNEELITPSITLVEDMMSAIVVGRLSHCVAILGSWVRDELIYSLRHDYSHINLWLDHDKQIYCMKRVKRYRSFGIDVRGIYTVKDPKDYEPNNIERRIHD